MSWQRQPLDVYEQQHLLYRLIDHIPAFSGFKAGDLVALLAHAEKCAFDAHEFVFREGASSDYLYLLVEGRVAIVKQGQNGEKKLAELGAGECFGEMSLVDHQPRFAGVRTLAPCILLRLSSGHIDEEPLAAAKLYRNLAGILSRRYREAGKTLLP